MLFTEMFAPGKIRDYDGPNLDWNLYYLEIINAQLAEIIPCFSISPNDIMQHFLYVTEYT